MNITKYNAPIFNGTLSAKYITKLNTNNHSKIDKTEKLDCSICIEPIHLEKFKLKKNDLVFLECCHVYHKKCLQSWVKSQIKNIDKPNCPMCRTMIVDYSKKNIHLIMIVIIVLIVITVMVVNGIKFY